MRTRSAPRSSIPSVTPICVPDERRPGDSGAACAGRAGAPLVEDSIEPAVEQVVVPARERCERLGEHVRAVDGRPQLRSRARSPGREVRRKRHRADVDAVADHHRVGDAFRQNPPELPPRDEQIVRPLEIDPKRGRRLEPLREGHARGQRDQRRSAIADRSARAGVRTTDTYSPLPGGDSHAWPRRPRPAVCASAITTAPS